MRFAPIGIVMVSLLMAHTAYSQESKSTEMLIAEEIPLSHSGLENEEK